jgi:hypothetical protein
MLEIPPAANISIKIMFTLFSLSQLSFIKNLNYLTSVHVSVAGIDSLLCLIRFDSVWSVRCQDHNTVILQVSILVAIYWRKLHNNKLRNKIVKFNFTLRG